MTSRRKRVRLRSTLASVTPVVSLGIADSRILLVAANTPKELVQASSRE